jgi:hypothetical protein
MHILRSPDDFFIPSDDDLDDLLKSAPADTNADAPAEGKPVKGYKKDNRIAKMDISESSKEDHRMMKRYTRKEAEDFLKKDYIYLQKKVIMPFAIVEDYPYKNKTSEKDVPDSKNSNVNIGLVLTIGRLPKWKNILHQLDESAYILGECMYVARGNYDIGALKPHIALVIHKKYRIIKPIDIRDLFDPIKNELQNGAPYVIYKEFPVPV